MNRPAKTSYFSAALEVIGWMAFCRAESGLQEPILLLRESNNHSFILFIFVHKGRFEGRPESRPGLTLDGDQ